MKENTKLFLLAVGLILILFIGFNVRNSDEGFLLDTKIMDSIHSNITVNGEKLMKVITTFGSKYFFALAGLSLFGIYILKKKRNKATMLFISIVISYGLNAILKFTFARTRPEAYMLVNKTSYSFPSGHAMVSMSFYCTMTYIISKRIHNRGMKGLLWVLNFVIVGLIGYSRLYLGVHWPTDILVGYILGFIVFNLSREKFGRI